jgi:hypothetical protein
VYNIQPTPNVPTVPYGTSGTSMGAVPKAADKFRAKATVRPPRQEYRQEDQRDHKAEKVLAKGNNDSNPSPTTRD